MESIFLGALAGTIIGAITGFGKISTKEQGTGVEDLGCDVPYLVADEYFYGLFKELRKFAHADWHAYNTICVTCDLIIQLWYHVHDPKTQPEVYLARRSFQYKSSVHKNLKLFWASVMNVKPAIVQRGLKSKTVRADITHGLLGENEGKKTNTAEFNALADRISQQTMAYNQEIITKLSEYGRITPEIAQIIAEYTTIDTEQLDEPNENDLIDTEAFDDNNDNNYSDQNENENDDDDNRHEEYNSPTIIYRSVE